MANPDDEYVEQIYQFVRKRLPDDICGTPCDRRCVSGGGTTTAST